MSKMTVEQIIWETAQKQAATEKSDFSTLTFGIFQSNLHRFIDIGRFNLISVP